MEIFGVSLGADEAVERAPSEAVEFIVNRKRTVGGLQAFLRHDQRRYAGIVRFGCGDAELSV